MTDETSPTDVVATEDMSIEEALDRVEEIISMLEEGDPSIPDAQELHSEAEQLLEYIEGEVTLGDGEVSRVTPEN